MPFSQKLPLNVVYTMAEKSKKWPKLKSRGSCLKQIELFIVTIYYLENLELFIQQLRTWTSKIKSKLNYLLTWRSLEFELFIAWKVCIYSVRVS